MKKQTPYTTRKLLKWVERIESPESTQLVLMLHGMDCGPNTIGNLKESVGRVWKEKGLPKPHVLIPQLPLRWYQCADLKRLAEEIVTALNGMPEFHSVDTLTVVGHSAGGVLAQAVFLCSREEPGWLSTIEIPKIRLVLLSPLNRGWAISHHLPLAKKISWLLGMRILPAIRLKEFLRCLATRETRDPPWIIELQRGSPFLIWVQLKWLAYIEELPHVIQLLGSIDEIISWRDMVAKATGEKFKYMEVPYSDHVTILDFDDPAHGKERQDKFERALRLPIESSGDGTIEPWDTDPIPPDENVQRVVFVIHGIRDEGHWTQKIGMKARQASMAPGTDPKAVAIVTSGYGYFSMLEFLRPSKRLEKIHWLADQYVEARRRYPNARFSYIAHSNGTYLLAHALNLYPDMRFQRIAFAGSVVSFRYKWHPILERYSQYMQTSETSSTSDENKMRVLNFSATNDCVVGFLPMVADILPPIQWLLGPDIGGAGVEPFSDNPVGQVTNQKYIIGSHGAAIQENHWEHLARFAVNGDIPPEEPEAYTKRRVPFLRSMAVKFVCPAVIVSIILLLFYLANLAWSDPLLFWGGLVLILGSGLLIVSASDSLLAQKPISERLRKRKRTAVILKAVVTVLVVYLAAGIWFLEYYGFWNQPAAWSPKWAGVLYHDTTRTLSLVLYVLGINSILTKV